MKIDLSFYSEPPELTTHGRLKIMALAPLSMVPNQPGSYFRSELIPTYNMMYGMLENVLGWHFSDTIRKKIIKGLIKKAKKTVLRDSPYQTHAWLQGNLDFSDSGFFSLLQFHLKFEEVRVDRQPLTYDDLWSMLLHDKGMNFIGGSRNYDSKLEQLITMFRQTSNSGEANISFGDRSEYASFTLEQLLSLREGKIKTTSLKPHFPMYYSSPKLRGYVLPKFEYEYLVHCTPKLFSDLKQAIDNPEAPPYLGTNDGWVNLKLEKI